MNVGTNARAGGAFLLLVEFIIQQELNFDGTSSHLERIT